MNELPLLEETFLKAQWHGEYAAFAASPEAALNALLYRLYALTPEEIALVEGA